MNFNDSGLNAYRKMYFVTYLITLYNQSVVYGLVAILSQRFIVYLCTKAMYDRLVLNANIHVTNAQGSQLEFED